MSNVSRQTYALKAGKNVRTIATLWRVPHKTQPSGISLKVGRYRLSDDEETWEPESLVPKSELTLDEDELKELIRRLQENYEPFRQGIKAFIPLEKPFERAN